MLIPEIHTALAFDPKILIPLLSGKGNGGPPLSFTATVPTDIDYKTEPTQLLGEDDAAWSDALLSESGKR